MASIVILGVLVSILFYEATDVTPGGIIVPGLMVLYFNQVTRILYTVGVAILAYFLVKLLSRRFIIFGKRRFVLLIIFSLGLHYLINFVFGLFASDVSVVTVSVIGYTISGIIANNIYKQGIKRTVPALAIVVCFLELIVIGMTQLGIPI